MNKTISLFLLATLTLLLVCNVQFVKAGDPWYDLEWDYRKSHVVENATGAGSNYQINITVINGTGSDSGATVYIDNKTRTDFGDVRFVDDDGSTLLDCWVETLNDGVNATFWVEIADNLNTTDVTIYMYYGNSEATSTSNGTDTFLAFDDFTSDTLDDAWTFVQSGRTPIDSYSLTDVPGKLRIYGSSQNSHNVVSLLKRDAPTNSYVQFVSMNGTWDTNYQNSGLYVGDGVGTSTGNRILGQVMHESSGSPNECAWQEKRVDSSRTVATPIERFAEPSFPTTIKQRYIKNGTEYYTQSYANGVWNTGPSQSYTSTTTDMGFTANNDDGNNAFTVDFDDYRCRKYVYPEPIQGTWGEEEEPPGITYYFNMGGQLEVNGSLVANDTFTKYITNDVVVLKGFPDGNKLFQNYTWDSNFNLSNPFIYTFNGTSITVWCNFESFPESSKLGFYIGSLAFVFVIVVFGLWYSRREET